MDRSGLARLVAAHAIDQDRDQLVVGCGGAGQGQGLGQGLGLGRHTWRGLDLGEQALQFGVAGRADQLLLSGESRFEFVGQGEPVLFGARAEIAERANDLLAGSFGGADAFDEEIVGVGLTLVVPRSFADIHILDTK